MKMDAKQQGLRFGKSYLKLQGRIPNSAGNFQEFIAGLRGSDKGAALLASTDMYKNAKVIFITPDNNLEKLRETAFRDKKTVVMTNYGITRGFFLNPS